MLIPRVKGLAFKANFEFIPSTFTIAVDASGGRLHCLLELRITIIRSLAQRSYRQSKNILNLALSFREAGAPSSGNKRFKMTVLLKNPVQRCSYVPRQSQSNVGTSHVIR